MFYLSPLIRENGNADSEFFDSMAPPNMPSTLRQESKQTDDSPNSQTSGPFARLLSCLDRRPSREHSIGSSFFGDTDSTNTEDIQGLTRETSNDWQAHGLGISQVPIGTYFRILDSLICIFFESQNMFDSLTGGPCLTAQRLTEDGNTDSGTIDRN